MLINLEITKFSIFFLMQLAANEPLLRYSIDVSHTCIVIFFINNTWPEFVKLLIKRPITIHKFYSTGLNMFNLFCSTKLKLNIPFKRNKRETKEIKSDKKSIKSLKNKDFLVLLGQVRLG